MTAYSLVTVDAIIRSALDAIVVIDADNRILEFNPAAEGLFGWSRAEALGCDVSEVLIPPEMREGHRKGLKRHLETGQVTLLDRRLEFTAIRRDGSQFPIELSTTRLQQHGNPVFAAFIRDITDRQKLRAEQARGEGRINAVVRAQVALAASAVPLSQLMDELAHLAQDALRGDGAVFELLAGEELVYRSVSGAASGHAGRRLRIDASLSGYALLRDEATFCSDCMSDPRVDTVAATALGAMSMVIAPIHAGTRPFGVLKVFSTRPHTYNQSDARAIELLTRSVSAVIARKSDEEKRLHTLATQKAIVEAQRELATSELELLPLMDLMAERAQALTGADGAVIEMIEGADVVYVAVSRSAAQQRGMRIPLATSLTGHCISENQVVVCGDTEVDLRVNREACRSLGVRAIVVAPLHAEAEIVGVLKVVSRHSYAFGAEEVRSLQILTETLGLLVQRARARDALKRVALIDATTRLPRFAAFEDDWNARLSQHAEQSVLLVNLDRFQAINETMGHRQADAILALVGTRLLAFETESLRVAHFAADEFVILAKGSPAETMALAETIREAVGAPLAGDGYRMQLGSTVGMAFAPQHGTQVMDLVRRAQFAMEHGKKLGRDRTSVFSTDQMQQIEDRVLLGESLRRAGANGELHLHYQPQVKAGTFEVVGFEALLRWKHAELGNVPPNRFIPIAEALGLMPDIGSWVLREATRQARAWLDAGLRGFTIAVNVSGQQLQRDGLIETVADALNACGLRGEVLEIEFTESSLMENVAKVRGELARLSAMGVTLSLDDFGTGYSSLAYLKHFHLHKLKIDKSFVSGLPGNTDDAAIAGMVVAIGHQLRLSVVAEGVETEEQAAFLSTLGCDGLQGYHFGRPVDPDSAARMLNRAAS